MNAQSNECGWLQRRPGQPMRVTLSGSDVALLERVADQAQRDAPYAEPPTIASLVRKAIREQFADFVADA